ncbi:preprotein translocase subunit YajC [Candidatus Foliamicus sp.]
MLLDILISPAWAQQGGESPSMLPMIFTMVLIFAVMYFMVIRPQSKRNKEHRALVAGLAEGDEVLASGGMVGKVIALAEQFVTLEVAKDVSVKVQRHSVSAVLPKGTIKSI